MSQETQFYRVIFKVRPSPNHPSYWDIQFGILCVWLYAESENRAGDHASRIVAELPYEIIGTKARIDLGPDDSFDKHAPERAKQIGLALSLHMCPTGVDEGDFENMRIS